MNDELLAKIFERQGEISGKLDSLQRLVVEQRRTTTRLDFRVRKLETKWAYVVGIWAALSAIFTAALQIIF